MPEFLLKNPKFRGHRLRYEDVVGVSEDQPEWMRDLLEEGAIWISPESETLEALTDVGVVGAPSGTWLLLSDSGRISFASSATLASEYDLL